VSSCTVRLAVLVAATALAVSASAGEADLELDLLIGSRQAAAPPDPTAVRELAPVVDEESLPRPATGASAHPLLLGGPVDQRLLDDTLRTVEPGVSPRAARSRSERPIPRSGSNAFEDPNDLVARQLGLGGIDPADLAER
jgi:hypothetical protein